MGAIEALQQDCAAQDNALQTAQERVNVLSNRVTLTPVSFARQRAIQDLQWAKQALAEAQLLADAVHYALDRALRIEAR